MLPSVAKKNISSKDKSVSAINMVCFEVIIIKMTDHSEYSVTPQKLCKITTVHLHFFNVYLFILFVCLGRAEVRPKSAEKCMAWSVGTNGAPPAAGRKPVSGSQTKQKRL